MHSVSSAKASRVVQKLHHTTISTTISTSKSSTISISTASKGHTAVQRQKASKNLNKANAAPDVTGGSPRPESAGDQGPRAHWQSPGPSIPKRDNQCSGPSLRPNRAAPQYGMTGGPAPRYERRSRGPLQLPPSQHRVAALCGSPQEGRLSWPDRTAAKTTRPHTPNPRGGAARNNRRRSPPRRHPPHIPHAQGA
ncbi:hypothetical protein NDU88_003387 [Pleurodeles waltl]|uniref:Uncharacterized protein n=1 Tax=Pleurodeles waltl TaxID=8319 RepID=A0AAV7QBL3_PLEWA|nr:hypothetical protein NDU88_003387 [Pleurodeles waltl]